MKKILFSFAVAMILLACKRNNEKPIETSTEKTEKEIQIKDTTNKKQTKITFENYKTEYKPVTQKAVIDFKSNPTAKRYKTVISETYTLEKVNFAGNYIIATWGCGTSCISGAMVDIRDGKVNDLPQDKETAILGNSYEARKESTLLITSISDVPCINNIIEIDTY